MNSSSYFASELDKDSSYILNHLKSAINEGSQDRILMSGTLT